LKNQKKVWEEAHSNPVDWPKVASVEPAEGVVYFQKFLAKKGIRNGTAVDVGCGQGRNAIYLAEKGFLVYAFDYVNKALEETRRRAALKKVEERVMLSLTAMDDNWPFEDDFFDAAVDSFSSIDIETLQGRKIYCSELFRTLKPGAYAFVGVVSIDDEFEKEIIAKSPGKEKTAYTGLAAENSRKTTAKKS